MKTMTRIVSFCLWIPMLLSRIAHEIESIQSHDEHTGRTCLRCFLQSFALSILPFFRFNFETPVAHCH